MVISWCFLLHNSLMIEKRTSDSPLLLWCGKWWLLICCLEIPFRMFVCTDGCKVDYSLTLVVMWRRDARSPTRSRPTSPHTHLAGSVSLVLFPCARANARCVFTMFVRCWHDPLRASWYSSYRTFMEFLFSYHGDFLSFQFLRFGESITPLLELRRLRSSFCWGQPVSLISDVDFEKWPSSVAIISVSSLRIPFPLSRWYISTYAVEFLYTTSPTEYDSHHPFPSQQVMMVSWYSSFAFPRMCHWYP